MESTEKLNEFRSIDADSSQNLESLNVGDDSKQGSNDHDGKRKSQASPVQRISEKRLKLRNIPSCIFGSPPIPDLVEHVRKFLRHTILSSAQRKIQLEASPKISQVEFEIEAKLGTIIDKNTNTRIKLPVYSETVCTYDNVRFDADMTMIQHRKYNEFLNSLVSSAGLKYKHTKEVDEFISNPEFKLRRTRDFITKEVTQVISKHRLGDLHIYNPAHPLDIRLSVNFECTMKEKVQGGRVDHQRIKDRLSYTAFPLQIDLTQVKNHENVINF